MIKIPLSIKYFSLILCLVSTIGCSFTSRNASKIYSDVFGKADAKCLQLLKSRDARAIDDCCVWLYFKTCPSELDRILSFGDYEKTVVYKKILQISYPESSKIDESMISNDPPSWWNPTRLGDSCIKFEYKTPDKDFIQFIYTSMDSTEVYYYDADY